VNGAKQQDCQQRKNTECVFQGAISSCYELASPTTK
jgi:hypothetical protein